jgi:hypothetical protein
MMIKQSTLTVRHADIHPFIIARLKESSVFKGSVSNLEEVICFDE